MAFILIILLIESEHIYTEQNNPIITTKTIKKEVKKMKKYSMIDELVIILKKVQDNALNCTSNQVSKIDYSELRNIAKEFANKHYNE
ncbi:hypothetical protein 15570_00001 [Lokiarchaeota virus WyrdV1]|nr:hypothetical protein 15570_00001 [Lokiarchaeota virus WyrdV1]